MVEASGQLQRKWPKYFYFLVPVVVTLLTLAMIELLLSLFWPVPPSMAMNMYYKADPLTGFAHEPNAVGHYPNGILAIANRQGFRDDEVTVEKPPNTRRILMLGDSFTVGVNVEMEEAYPQVLERMMNESAETPVEIINAGLGGSEPFQYAQYFERHGAEYSPDEVMVGLFVGNDTYTVATSVEDVATVVNGHRVSREAAEGDFVEFRIMLHENVNLVRLLKGVSLVQVSPHREHCEDFSDNLLMIARNRLSNHRIDFSAHPVLPANTVNQILRIKQKADDMGVPLTVVLIPDELQISKALRDRVVPAQELSIYNFAMPQQMLTEKFAALGIATFDLLPFFQQDERCIYMNDTHWNPEGHVVAAAAIEEYISRPLSERVQERRPVAVSSGPKMLPIKEAVVIIQAYIPVLGKSREVPATVLDSSQLPFPKSQIQAAALTLHLATVDPAEQKSFIDIANSLARFQPDVGETPIAFDRKKHDGTTWRSIVKSDLQAIEQTVTEIQR